MADWYVRFKAQGGSYVGTYSMMQPEVEIRNSEPGGFSCELALAHKRRRSETLGITRDQFAPYRTHYEVWRQSSGTGKMISEGMVTSINLNKDRDTVLVSGKDWLHYLQRRIYPFTPEDYVGYDEDNPHTWRYWPKRWPLGGYPEGVGPPSETDPVEVMWIIRDILCSMRTGNPIDIQSSDAQRFGGRAPGVPNFVWDLKETGLTTKYKIYPGDQTTIYDHITTISEQIDGGFEFDISPSGNGAGPLTFRMWNPTKYIYDLPLYHWRPTEVEDFGAIVEFDWTNDGPDGTYLIGLGTNKISEKVGQTWTDIQTVNRFGRLDLVYDYGAMVVTEMMLEKLKDQNDLWPQKKLSLTLSNPEFLVTNFYTADRPRSLVAAPIRVTYDFTPLHRVDAFFKINAIKWSIDPSSNEQVSFELEMIYEPDTGRGVGGMSDPD